MYPFFIHPVQPLVKLAILNVFVSYIGYCEGLSAGWIDVTLNVGQCAGYGTYDFYTGWNSISRIIIEEVPASPY